MCGKAELPLEYILVYSWAVKATSLHPESDGWRRNLRKLRNKATPTHSLYGKENPVIKPKTIIVFNWKLKDYCYYLQP